MIAFLSKWAEGIVIAVVLATIIELILPNSRNKKYVKMIVGVYIVFTIISPMIDAFTDIDLSSLDFQELLEQDTKEATSTNVQTHTNNYITTLYIKNLQKDMQSKLEAKGYGLKKVIVEVEEESEEMPIQTIQLVGVYKKQAGVQAVNKVEIMAEETQEGSTLNQQEIEEIKSYFSQTYAVLKENIEIV